MSIYQRIQESQERDWICWLVCQNKAHLMIQNQNEEYSVSCIFESADIEANRAGYKRVESRKAELGDLLGMTLSWDPGLCSFSTQKINALEASTACAHLLGFLGE